MTSGLHTCVHRRQEHLYTHTLPPPFPSSPTPLSHYKHFPQQLVSCFSPSSHSSEYQLSHQPSPASHTGFSFQETACLEMPSNPTARGGTGICPVGGTESTTARATMAGKLCKHGCLGAGSVERWVWLVKTASSAGERFMVPKGLQYYSVA